MDKPIKHLSGRKIRGDMKVGEVKYKGLIPPQPTLTKVRFEALFMKSVQPLKLDSKVKGTSVSHLSDGYSGRCKSQDKTVNKKGLQE
jgi:hypothetical protein